MTPRDALAGAGGACRPSAAPPALLQRLPALGLVVCLAAAAAAGGCGDGTPPTGIQGSGMEEGDLFRIEGSRVWSVNSVAWPNRNESGVVPQGEYGMIAISLEASDTGPSHFFYTAPVDLSCSGCFPGRGSGWTDPTLIMEHLDWSPVGARIVFGGQVKGQRSRWIYTRGLADEEPRRVLRGVMPSFFRNGAKVVYVDEGRSAVRWFNADGGGGGGEIIGGRDGVENPALSPGDSLLAFSAFDSRGWRRIFVQQVDEPGFFPDTVTDPDDGERASQDGKEDNFPAWSPRSRFLAYRSTVTRFGGALDAIFVTIPSLEPEPIKLVKRFSAAEEVTYLRWHPNGRLLLFIVDGDVHMLVMPERYWDQAP